MTNETVEKTSYTNSTPLRVKRINLADEARTIRKEERKALAAAKEQRQRMLAAAPMSEKKLLTWDQEFTLSATYRSLREHRVGIVRSAARTNHLAHTFLTGRPYAQVEHKIATDNEPDWEAIRKTAFRFGKYAGLDPDLLTSRWEGWKAVGRQHINHPLQAPKTSEVAA